MINREYWETVVNRVRQDFLEKTSDPDFRRITAGIMDAAFDEVYRRLMKQEVSHDVVTLTEDQFEQVSQNSLKVALKTVQNAPDWLEDILSAYSTQLKCDLFLSEKEE